MSEPDAPSPAIDAFEWGRIESQGRVYKDAKLWPGGGREWDWRETGTRHNPGVQVADAEELLARGARVVVLSRGVNEALQVPPETVAALEARGVIVHVAQTERAVRLWNELRRSEPALGGLFHSTC